MVAGSEGVSASFRVGKGYVPLNNPLMRCLSAHQRIGVGGGWRFIAKKPQDLALTLFKDFIESCYDRTFL